MTEEGHALGRLLRDLCGGRYEAAERLLDEQPKLADQSLAAACLAGRVLRTRSFLAEGEDPNAPAAPGLPMPPLWLVGHSAFLRREPRGAQVLECAAALLDAGADPQFKLNHRVDDMDVASTVLAVAAGGAGHAGFCRLLIDRGAELEDGAALYAAMKYGQLECAAVLLDAGLDVNAASHPSGYPVLHWILDWHASVSDDDGKHPTNPSLAWLLEHGADPMRGGGSFGETAVHVAVRRRRTALLDMLVEAGASLDAATAGGRTAYQHAVCRGFDDTAAKLLALGADPTLTVADELCVALLAGEVAAARDLIGKHPEAVRAMTPEQARILPDLAGRADTHEAMGFLLDAGLDVTARGLDGGTALHMAAWFCQPDNVEFLLARGAPLDISGDRHCSTPLGWVCHGSRFSDGSADSGAAYARIAEMLLSAGASLAHPVDREEDPHGRWLLVDAREPVAEVLRRHGARDDS